MNVAKNYGRNKTSDKKRKRLNINECGKNGQNQMMKTGKARAKCNDRDKLKENIFKKNFL